MAIASDRVDLSDWRAEVRPIAQMSEIPTLSDTELCVAGYTPARSRCVERYIVTAGYDVEGFRRTTSCKYCYLWIWVPRNDIMEALGINRTNNMGLN